METREPIATIEDDSGTGTELYWKVSTRTGPGANCVEAAADEESVFFRDSKDPEGGTLTFSLEDAATFLAIVKAGRLDMSR